MSIDQRIIKAAEQLEKDVKLTYDIVNGDENTEVMTAGGPVPTHAKVSKDNNLKIIKLLQPTVNSINQHAKLITSAADRTTAQTNQAIAAAGEARASANTAASSASAAGASETNAATSETNAAGSATAAARDALTTQGDKAAVTSMRNEVEADRTEVVRHKALTLGYRDEAKTARDEARQAASVVTGTISELGNFDASTNSLPSKPKTSAFWKITSAGRLNGEDYGVGDSLVYSKNTDSFYKIDNTESVTSVNGKQGVVTLIASDVGALPASITVADLGGYTKAESDSFLALKSNNHTHPYRPDNWTPTFSDVRQKPSTYPPATHNHDGRYYTEAEVDALLTPLKNRLSALEAKLANVTVSGSKTTFNGVVKAQDVEVTK